MPCGPSSIQNNLGKSPCRVGSRVDMVGGISARSRSVREVRGLKLTRSFKGGLCATVHRPSTKPSKQPWLLPTMLSPTEFGATAFINESKPEVVVMIGDFYDIPSASSYDQGKKSFGRRSIDTSDSRGVKARQKTIQGEMRHAVYGS